MSSASFFFFFGCKLPTKCVLRIYLIKSWRVPRRSGTKEGLPGCGKGRESRHALHWTLLKSSRDQHTHWLDSCSIRKTPGESIVIMFYLLEVCVLSAETLGTRGFLADPCMQMGLIKWETNEKMPLACSARMHIFSCSVYPTCTSSRARRMFFLSAAFGIFEKFE